MGWWGDISNIARAFADDAADAASAIGHEVGGVVTRNQKDTLNLLGKYNIMNESDVAQKSGELDNAFQIVADDASGASRSRSLTGTYGSVGDMIKNPSKATVNEDYIDKDSELYTHGTRQGARMTSSIAAGAVGGMLGGNGYAGALAGGATNFESVRRGTNDGTAYNFGSDAVQPFVNGYQAGSLADSAGYGTGTPDPATPAPAPDTPPPAPDTGGVPWDAVEGAADAGLGYVMSQKGIDAANNRNQDSIDANAALQQGLIDAARVKGVGSTGRGERVSPIAVNNRRYADFIYGRGNYE